MEKKEKKWLLIMAKCVAEQRAQFLWALQTLNQTLNQDSEPNAAPFRDNTRSCFLWAEPATRSVPACAQHAVHSNAGGHFRFLQWKK